MELTLPLLSPVIVPPGSYAVFAESSHPNVTLLTGPTSSGYSSLVADSYSRNAYNYSAANFPAVTYVVTYYPGQDALGQIIGTTCVNGEALTAVPACVPRPFQTYPSSPTTAASLPCSGSSVVYTNTYNSSLYNYESQSVTDAVRLTPITAAVAQTLYAVSFLIHPETSATTTFTLRPALYAMSSTTGAFTLLAQANRTTIAGSTLSGQFTYLYFPIYPPVYVAANTTVYINRVVDQAGLYMVFDQTGSTYTASTVVTSAMPAPGVLVASGSGGLDASRGLLGCAAAAPPSGPCATGSVIINGPTVDTAIYYWPVDQLVGSVRTLKVTQQVNSLSMSVYWAPTLPNTVPVRLSLALYGPPNCGPQGESQLLAVTSVYTFAVGELTGLNSVLMNLPLTSPVIVAPGSYAVFAESDNPYLTVVTGNTLPGYSSLVADSYTRNTYSFTAAPLPQRHLCRHLLPDAGHAGGDRGHYVRVECDADPDAGLRAHSLSHLPRQPRRGVAVHGIRRALHQHVQQLALQLRVAERHQRCPPHPADLDRGADAVRRVVPHPP